MSEQVPEMCRYFLDVVRGESTAHGQDFANLEGAKAHVATIARQLAQDCSHYGGYSVCIVDEQRKEWGRVSVGYWNG
jgi:hypothetical protein